MNIWSKCDIYSVSKARFPSRKRLSFWRQREIWFFYWNKILSLTICSPPDENVTDRTMAAETKLFLHKIEVLSKLVSAIKLWEPSRESELQDIESRLRNLSIFVEQDKCLNAGGKFEWVDSVLVKVFHQWQAFITFLIT